MKIKIHQVEKLKSLLRQGMNAGPYNILVNYHSRITEVVLESPYITFIKSLELSIPHEYKPTALHNDLNSKEPKLRPELLTGILYVMLVDHTYDRNDINFIGYKVSHLQKLFAHLDKGDILKLKEFLPAYNELLRKLTAINHPFGYVQLNQYWDIVGDQVQYNERYMVDIQGKIVYKTWTPQKLSKSWNPLASLLRQHPNKTFFITSVFGMYLSYFYPLLLLFTLPIVAIGLFVSRYNQNKNKFRRIQTLALFSLLGLYALIQCILPSSNFKKLDVFLNRPNYQLVTHIDQNGILTLYNKSQYAESAEFEWKNTVKASFGDTIVVSTIIHLMDGKDSQEATVYNYPAVIRDGNSHTLLAKVENGLGEELYDTAKIIAENFQLRSLGIGKVLHVDGDKTTTNPLTKKQESALRNRGLHFSDLKFGIDKYTVINAYYVVESVGKPNEGFNPDPAFAGIGFVTINFGEGSANEQDLIKAPRLKPGEKFNFKIFLDFHNYGLFDIQNAESVIEGWVNYPDLNSSAFSASLNADNVKSISDETEIVGLPEEFEIKLEKTLHLNSRAATTNDKCAGYGINRWVTNNELINGVDLGVLDTFNNGWCDRGFVIYYFTLQNTGD